MSREGSAPASDGSKFRTTLIRVLIVQAAAMALLGLIQVLFNV